MQNKKKHFGNTMKYSPTQALLLLPNVTRKKLYEMMANGVLSYSVDNNKRLIDASELVRVFGDDFVLQKHFGNTYEETKKQKETEETFQETLKFDNEKLSIELENAKKIIEELRKDKEDYKDRLNKAQDLLSQQMLVLSDLRSKNNDDKKLAEAYIPVKRKWFKRKIRD
jgi:hypothetical protein